MERLASQIVPIAWHLTRFGFNSRNFNCLILLPGFNLWTLNIILGHLATGGRHVNIGHLTLVGLVHFASGDANANGSERENLDRFTHTITL